MCQQWLDAQKERNNEGCNALEVPHLVPFLGGVTFVEVLPDRIARHAWGTNAHCLALPALKQSTWDSLKTV